MTRLAGRPRRWPLVGLGALLAVLGEALLAGLAAILYWPEPGFGELELGLGLAASSLLLGLGLGALLIGLWTLHRGLFPHRPQGGG